MKKSILAITPAVTAALFLSGNPAFTLVGADVADRTVQRYTVAIASPKGRCSGVVLAPDIVLTAGHCIQPGEKFQVGGNTGGGYQTLPPTLLSNVDQIVVHPLYKPTDSGSPDLAMLKLAKPLPDFFIPATLNARGLSVGDDLIAAGFGKTAARDSKAGITLRMVLLRVSDSFKGWVMLASVGEDASGGGAGDSGGPMFSYRGGMHSLVGIIVAVAPTRTKAVALAAHYDWIKETMQKLSAP
jgi:secreted trypsin-like serine protease